MTSPSSEKSTTVRTISGAAQAAGAAAARPDTARASAAPALLRAAFKVLEYAAPGVGRRMAWKQWCTPVRPPSDAVARSRAKGMGEVREVPIALPDWSRPSPSGPGARPRPPRETRIAVELLGPEDGPIVYLLHGWSGWRGQFAPLGRALAESGYRVIMIDTPNHGDSGPGCLGPNLSLPPDFTLTLAAIAEHFGPAHAVVGHSLGGGCVALALLDGLKAERAVFISPAVNPVAYTRQLAGVLGFGERIRTRMVKQARRRTGRELSEFVVPPRASARRDLPPALIVHDHDDAMVPPSNGRELAHSWSNARYVETRGLGHLRILRDASVLEAAVAFIAGKEPATTAARIDARSTVG